METDDDVVGEGLALFVGGGEGQDDHLVGQVLLARSVNRVDDVGCAEAAVAFGGPKQGLIAYGVGFKLYSLLAAVLVGAGVTSKVDVLDGEEDFINPGVVVAACASGVLLVDPAEGVLALRHGEDHLAPVE